MITAKYCDNFPKALQPLFTLCVQLVSKRLGIDEYDASVKLCIQAPRITPETGSPELAWMAPAVVWDNEKRMQQGLAPNQYDLVLSMDLSPSKMMAAFSHEMIHVKQWLTKQLFAKTMRQSRNQEDHRLYYYGTPLIMSDLPYKERPWEEEAHRSMYELSDWLFEEVKKRRPDIIKATTRQK